MLQYIFKLNEIEKREIQYLLFIDVLSLEITAISVFSLAGIKQDDSI